MYGTLVSVISAMLYKVCSRLHLTTFISVACVLRWRQDLVTEKIKCQQLTNELQKLTHELDKVGLDKEKLVAAEQAQDERYHAMTNATGPPRSFRTH